MVEMGSPASLSEEPLEETAESGVGEVGPDAALLAELGSEFDTTVKPAETPKEGINDAVDELAGEPEPVEAKDEEVETPSEEPKGRAQKRIQSLANEKKELKQRLDQQNQEFQRQMQYVQQQQAAQMQAQAQQTALLQKQLEIMSRQTDPVEDDSNLTPMEKYEKDLLKKAETRAAERMAPQIQRLEQELQRQNAEKVASTKRARQRASLQRYTVKAQTAANEYLMRDVDTGAFTPEDTQVGANLILSYVAATGCTPEEAGQQFRGWLDKHYQGRMKNVSKTSGRTIQQSQRVPAPMQPSTGTVQEAAKPTWAALRTHGYDNYVQWMRAGSPPLLK